ncbi:kell blood group glycoprotein isoform X2 [Stegastes partitus]|uniref:Kell blood group glycoprotein-like n=1 Tax=Stegastes partitus TaxID=144197 RepID=A0A3B4ZF75_9TELE|nr:PREDICTED: kell blood group glycoprotein-like isoform X2 [Stegastes partitus]
MSETPTELELQPSVQPSSQPEPELGLQPPTLIQNPLQDQHQLQPASQSDQQHQPKPLCRNLLLLLLGFSLCAAMLGMIYYLHHSRHTENQSAAVSPCVSAACRSASARLSSSADPFTQPCEYFTSRCGSDSLSEFGGSGGGRMRGQGIPGHPQNQKDQSVWPERRRDEGDRRQTDRKTLLLQHLREILETNDRSSSSAVQKTRRFYNSCLDTTSIEMTGAEPFLSLIQKLGGWAVSGRWNQTDFNSTLSSLMRDFATFPFFNLYVGKDPNEVSHGSTRRYIQIDQPDLLIPIEWNSRTQKSEAKTETLRPFLASCQRYLALLGAPPMSSMIHVGLFISLSSELAVAASPLQHRLQKGQLHQRMTVRELQQQAPAIDWLGCLQAAFHPRTLSEDDPVLLHNLPYILQMSRIIQKWLNRHELSGSGPLHTYMVLNLLHTLMPAMPANFSAALGNTEGEDPRWKLCVLETERGFSSVLTHLVSERTEHRQAEEMIQHVFSSFKSKLKELQWTDPKFLELVMKKLGSLTPRLWTSEESSEDELDRLISEVTVDSNSFFSNYIQLLSLWQKRRSNLLTESEEAADILSVTPLLLGAELLFPLGMFVPPLFHHTYPRAMNYGATGFLLAKDILHLLLPNISSHSESVSSVGSCVWTLYQSVSEAAGRRAASSLSPAQQQELWLQYSALQVALQAYQQSLQQRPGDSSLSGRSHAHLFLTAFSQVNCDVDPYRDFMPLEPSFFITVICSRSNLCPANLQCSIKPQHDSPQTC